MATPAASKELDSSQFAVSTAATHSPVSTAQISLAGVLLVLAFWPILLGIYGSWFDERTYMEHGILVVPAAAYMAWTERERLKQAAGRPSGWGVVLLLAGALQATLAVVAQWAWVGRMAFLVSLVGCILLIYGREMVQRLMYPLCTLILMIAPPTFVFERLTLSLQLLASSLGAACLEALGYSVLREGNILEMVGIKLSVEEACSGIRSLLAIIFMCVLYNFFFVRGRSMKIWILAMAIPVAILGNAGRIVASGIAGQYNHAWVTGATHEAFGYVSVLIAALGCVGLHQGTLFIQKIGRRHA